MKIKSNVLILPIGIIIIVLLYLNLKKAKFESITKEKQDIHDNTYRPHVFTNQVVPAQKNNEIIIYLCAVFYRVNSSSSVVVINETFYQVLQSLKKSPDIIRKISGYLLYFDFDATSNMPGRCREFEKSWPENAWLKKMALAEGARLLKKINYNYNN